MTQTAMPHAARVREHVQLPEPPAVLAALNWLAALLVAELEVFGTSSRLVADIFGIIATFGVAWMLMHAAYGRPDLRSGLHLAGVALVVLGGADVLAAAQRVNESQAWLVVPYAASTFALVLGIGVLAWGHVRRRDLGLAALCVALLASLVVLGGSRSADVLGGTIDRGWTLLAALVGGVAALAARPAHRSADPHLLGGPREPDSTTRTPAPASNRWKRDREWVLGAEDVRRGVRENRLVVHYQPVVDLVDGRVVGAEALIRLVDPIAGLVTAEHFLPVAHSLGLMREITSKVLESACTDFAAGPPAELGWWVAINLGEDEIADPQVCRQIGAARSRAGLPAARLVIEVTERALPGVQTRHALADIAGTGVRIALDDFGSGWSSFAQLWALPLDQVKLDRDLVADARFGRNADLLRTVIGMAAELELEILAEGIEDASQVEPLRAAGCQLGQGYVWGRPVSITELVARWGRDVSRIRSTSDR